MFARFDENPAMTLRVIKETKRYGRTDNVKNSIPPTNKVCGGYNDLGHLLTLLSTSEGGGGVAGFFPQIWPHNAGLGAPQENCKPETTPGELFSMALKS